MSTVTQLEPEVLKTRIERFRQVQSEIVTQVRRVIVGQEEVLDQVMIALFVGGHCLITGLPGTAKTLLVRTMAQTLGLVFKRIQFTPDLMPSDITGTDISERIRRPTAYMTSYSPRNILLADEINRVPKTQSRCSSHAERSCTVRGNITLPTRSSFWPPRTRSNWRVRTSPSAARRFLFNTVLDYLSADEELQVVDLTTVTTIASADPVTTAKEIVDFQQLVRMVPIGASVSRYVVDMVRVTRSSDENAPDFVKKYVNYGGSVRAAQFLVLAAKARALMKGRYHVTYEDVRALYIPVLRHRILLNFHAESDRLKQDDILKKILEWKLAPRD
jgi:MoxR-like ATPase